ncbi:hypothetical protein [Adhaeribacter aquaticus]|uniref:hypothetical protein n=1 Tax=Adhaeribacter aquaticus TaxID=299567 RepID=UPI00146FA92F|nr:hypothetical protein [Adhaeribacter aquaticus]
MVEIAGQKVIPLDIRLSYSLKEVLDEFDKLGLEGRKLYKYMVVQIDLIYPVMYGLFFILVLAFLLKNLFNTHSKYILFSLIPAFGVAFDYLENLNTIKLLNTYPHLSAQDVAWGELMTRMKHGILFFSIGLTVFLALVLLVKKIMQRQNNKPYFENRAFES